MLREIAKYDVEAYPEVNEEGQGTYWGLLPKGLAELFLNSRCLGFP